ncbi:MAG TPA: hypothetical protein VFX96_02505 [Pyrinomonadaceae bacterium]|nr:hypothetical protein [Pyrinomonadaceae bacterium]
MALAAALTLTGAAVCAAATQSKSARRTSKRKVATATTPAPAPNTDAASDAVSAQPAESAPAKRNARGEEKTDAKGAAPADATTPPKGAGDAKSRDALPGDGAAKVAKPAEAAAVAQYVYEFENPEFVVNRIRVEHDAKGRGRVTFERRSYVEPVVEPLTLSAAAWARVSALWESLRFLDSEESYQTEKQFPHLGTTRLKLRAGGRERATEFNYTSNEQARLLASEYRRAADQAIFVFDLAVARESQPLEAPKLLDTLDRMIKYNMLSDPAQLVPVLGELQTDERLPLIARNHAARILKKLKK